MNKILFAFLLLSIITLSGCAYSPERQLNNPNNLPDGVSNYTTTTNKLNADNFTYYNDKYAFEVTFPNTWKSLVITPRTIDWGTIGNSDSLDFGLPAQSSLFNIVFIKKDVWNKNLIPEQEPIPLYLGERDDIVFAFSQAQSTTNDEMSKRYAEITMIRKSFKLK